jgi:hypothetical protein
VGPAAAALAAAEDAAVAAAAAGVQLEGFERPDSPAGAGAAAQGAPLSLAPPPAGPADEQVEGWGEGGEEDDDDVAPPPPPPPPPCAAGGQDNVPWQMMFRAAGAGDVSSITELQPADSNALLKELAARQLPADSSLQVRASALPGAAGCCVLCKMAPAPRGGWRAGCRCC